MRSLCSAVRAIPPPGSHRLTEWQDPYRFLAGLDLFRVGKAPRLLVTGAGSPFSPGKLPQGQHYLEEAALLGVPEAAIASSPPVVNTAEEARVICRLLPASQSRALLVTSAFHMRRSQRLFEREGIHVRPFPVTSRPAAAGQARSGLIPPSGCPLL